MSFIHGISLHVTVYIGIENVDNFFAAFKPVLDKVIAEPECLFFEVYRSPDNLGHISWVEDWAAMPSWFLNHQMKKDYYKEYLAITEPMFIRPRRVEILERLEPRYFVAKNARTGQ
jgi:quinol monooxygenase YgiN